MFRFIWNLLRFQSASERRADVQRDLKSSYQAARAKADMTGQDYFLSRDLAKAKDEDKRKPK